MLAVSDAGYQIAVTSRVLMVDVSIICYIYVI